ncbi:hypothetical protein ACSHT2_27270 [Bradyrhizobium sp. PUT101]|uniref:hypothetical protein n=1 Tax=Bradyrhizobium sp. PUT101 TaxID=3447427 RepID=UPI003F850F9B
MHTTRPSKTRRAASLALMSLAVVAMSFTAAHAAPTAEVAKRCLRYAYTLYPYKRPGAVPMSGDRQAYFQDCMGKNGDVPPPARAGTDATSTKMNDAAATKN